MNLASVLCLACAAWFSLLLAIHIFSAVAAQRAVLTQRTRARRADHPAVSILIPVKDVVPRIEAAFVSVFSQTYPRFEVVISAAEPDLQALEIGRRVAARFPHVQSRFIVQDVRVAVSPKLNNLATPIVHAEHDLILVKDSNVHLTDGQLAEFVQYLTPGVGLVCSVPIAGAAENLAAEIECSMLNGRGARLLLAASVFQINIGIGAFMLFDRRDLARAGGISAIAHAIGEDHALSKALARIGLRTAFATFARQIAGRRTFRDVWNRQLRWAVIRRVEEPFIFYAEPFFGLVLTTLAGAPALSWLGMPWWIAGTLPLALWLFVEALFLIANGFGWSWRTAVATICREFMVLGLAIHAAIAGRIIWGGQPLEVRSGSI